MFAQIAFDEQLLSPISWHSLMSEKQKSIIINNQVYTSIYQLQLAILAKSSLALIGQCGHWFQLTLRWRLWSTRSRFTYVLALNDVTSLVKVCFWYVFRTVERRMDDVFRVTMVYQKWLNPIELSFERSTNKISFSLLSYVTNLIRFGYSFHSDMFLLFDH